MACIEIRHATLRDIDNLVRIHRECFPEEVLYQVPKSYAKRWWSFLLSSDSVEVYVVSINGKVAGFSTLKIDALTYQREKKKHKAPLLIRVYTVLVSPKIFTQIIRKFFYSLFSASNNTANQKNDNKYSSTCTWIDPLVISSKYRRKGLAKQFLTFLDKRTVELSRKTIVSMVAINNEPSIQMHENFGYELTGHISGSYFFYKKELNLERRDYKGNPIKLENYG